MLNLERWQQIDALLQAALERGLHEREAFLEEACAGDDNLRLEVESLLSSAVQASSLIDSPAFEAAAGLLAEHVPELNPGAHLGPYRIVSFLGAGGMGEVYLAEDTELGRKIAVKLLPAEFTRDRQGVARFRQEARAASALNHPNILTIHQISQHEGRHFMATEFVDGETLRQYLKRSKPVLREALDIAIQVTGALSAAHQAGIVHHDIKPENIMLRRDGYVKVLDFGLAKLIEGRGDRETRGHGDEGDTLIAASPRRDASASITSTGLIMGTMRYMSPEQARGLPTDRRSDIFSLGVVLFEMLTGQLPVKSKTVKQIIELTREETASLAKCLPDAPLDLQELVDKALSNEVVKRYQTAEELLVDLKAIKQRLEHSAAPAILTPAAAPLGRAPADSNRTTPSFDPVRQIGHRSRTLAFIFAALLVAAIAVAIGVRGSLRRATPTLNVSTFEITKLTDNGRIEDAAISPDGNTLVYSLTDAEGSSLWLKQLPTGNPERLLKPEGYAHVGLVFAKDASRIYFTKTENGSEGALYQIPVDGGSEVKLIESVDTPISLSPDGSQMAYIQVDHAPGERAVMIASVDGTNTRKIYSRIRPEGVGFLAWSPAGDSLICTLKEALGDSQGNRFHVVSMRLADGSQTELLTQRWNVILNVACLKDMSGFLMIAKREEKDNFQIWQVAYSNGEARRITSDSFDHHDFRLTADDRCLITVQVERNNTISIIDDRVTSDLQSHEIMKGYSRNDGENGLAWSPDGKLVYAAKVDGNGDIWSMNADGSDRKRLTSAADLDVQPVVTRDGRSIVYVSRTNGRRNIWRMDIDGAHQTQLTAGNSELEPTITPDAKVVLFTNGDFGKRLLYSVSIDGGSANRLSEKNIRGPAAVSPDGRLVAVFFLDEKSEPKRWKILIMYFDGREMKVLDPSPPVNSNSSLKWTADGSGLTYSVSNEGQSSIYFLPIEGGPPRQVSNPAIGAITWFDWSPDGQRLAIARLTESSDAVLLRNFR